MTDETTLNSDSALSRFFDQPNAIEEYSDAAPVQFEGYLPEDRIVIPAQISKSILGQTYDGFGGINKGDLEYLSAGAQAALGITLDAKGKIASSNARGHVFVGHKDKETGEATTFKFAELKMIPMVNLVHWIKNEQGYNVLVGARTYWPEDPVTGARDLDPSVKPACRTNNGDDPVAFYVGRDTNRPEINAGYDHRFGTYIPFGFDEFGNQLTPGSICHKCPFGQFKTVNGKSMPPTCKESFNFIIWLPGQMDLDGNWMTSRLAVLSGNNTSITQALKGRTPGQTFGHLDKTKALVSILKFRDSKKTEKFVAFENLTEEMLPSITFITATNSAADKGRNKNIRKVNKGSVTSLLDLQQLKMALASQFEAKYAVVEIEQFLWAPNGLPDLVPGAQIYPVSLSIAENNSEPTHQKIPYLQVGGSFGTFFHDALSEEEVYEFQEANRIADGYRAKWKEQVGENTAAVAEKLAALNSPHITIEENPMLGDGIEEGRFSSIDD